MEVAKSQKVRHLLMASTSSVYGANDKMPFTETDRADTQLTIYAATKKANESMAHAYAPLDLPTTMFRFFTVYGPWGRPDLAYYKFVDAILDGRPIDVYNHGDMYRDFTHVGDLVQGIRMLVDAVPRRPDNPEDIPTLTACRRSRHFGSSTLGTPIRSGFSTFIDAIEDALGIKATRNYTPMQPGDVHATWACTRLLRELTGFVPDTNFKDGIREFVEWYRDYRGTHEPTKTPDRDHGRRLGLSSLCRYRGRCTRSSSRP